MIIHTEDEWIELIDSLDWNPDVMVKLREKGHVISNKYGALVNRIIFENEEEAKKVRGLWHDWKSKHCSMCQNPGGCNLCFIGVMKENNLIRKPAIEEAEDLYQEYVSKGIHSESSKLIKLQYKAIQELKQEIARIKR